VTRASRPGASRVLLITAAGEPGGGAEVTMTHLAVWMDRAQHAPVMAAPVGSPLLDFWRGSGLEVAGTPPVQRLRDPFETSRAIDGIATIVRDGAIDMVHTHGVAAQIHGGLGARRAGRPVVAHAQDMFDTSWTRNGLLHRIARAVPRDATIASSAAVAASLQMRAPHGSCEVIPNPVETAIVAPVNRPGPLVVWCGRLQRWKGCHLFLDAAREVLSARPDARFAVVGGTVFGLEPGYPEELRQHVRRLCLDDAVEFTGHVSDARPWMRASSVCVHSSERPEPFGLVMAEAMIQERPVVAFMHGGAAEIVVNGRTGTLVPPGDTHALAQAIERLLGDDESRRAMGQAARARAVELYGAEVITRRVEQVYDRVLAARAS
jgi:glycosyltransferase involved in cell wall biosynthesis